MKPIKRAIRRIHKLEEGRIIFPRYLKKESIMSMGVLLRGVNIMEAHDAVTIFSTRKLITEDDYGDVIDSAIEFDTSTIRKIWV